MGLLANLGGFLDLLRKTRKRDPFAPSVPSKPAEEERFKGYDAGEIVVVAHITDKVLQEFLYFGAWLRVQSSNVFAIRYLVGEYTSDLKPVHQYSAQEALTAEGIPPGSNLPPAKGGMGVLLVQFNNTCVYEYRGISVEQAYDFAQALSKGRWVWDHLRSAGVWYLFLYSLTGHVPRRINPQSKTSQKRLAGYLARMAAQRRRNPRFANLPKFQRVGLKKIRSIIRG